MKNKRWPNAQQNHLEAARAGDKANVTFKIKNEQHFN